MNRTDFQIVADDRVADARALLDSGRWAAAYYLLGYAVECAFKACAAKRFRESEVPEKSLVASFYTHNLETLLIISEAKSILADQAARDRRFALNWATVREWHEGARYEHSISEEDARKLYAAVCDPSSGVLQCLKTMW